MRILDIQNLQFSHPNFYISINDLNLENETSIKLYFNFSYKVLQQATHIIIRCVFFFLSIGQESTTWPANNCLQIMVCSCVVPSKRVLLQIIFCSCVIGTTFLREKWQIASLSCQEVIKIWKQTWWSNDKTIIELGYHEISWFVSVSQTNYLPQSSASANNWSARHWQITIFCSTSSNNC